RSFMMHLRLHYSDYHAPPNLVILEGRIPRRRTRHMKANLICLGSIALAAALVAAGVRPPADAKNPHAPVSALAYRPDGKWLAAAGNREVLLIDVATNDVVARLPGQSTKVTALAFSKDGQRLAVASGEPAKSGEVRIYAVPAGQPPAN